MLCFILTHAALHPHQCCVSSLLMLRFMTHIAHNDAITTLSLHHSFSHYETTFLYIRASLAHVLDSQFKLYSTLGTNLTSYNLLILGIRLSLGCVFGLGK